MSNAAIETLQKTLYSVNRSIELYKEQVTYCEAELKTATEDLAKREYEKQELIDALAELLK